MPLFASPLSHGRVRFLWLIMATGLLLHSAATPIPIGSRLQVLWDDEVIDVEKTTAKAVLHHPEFDGVALVLTNAWDNGGGGYRNIFHDGEKYRMYYGAYAIGGTNGCVICCAESKDGLTWTKPSLGIRTFRGSRANNIILDTSVEPGLDNCYVFCDDNPNCPPDERYKAVVARELHLPLDTPQPPGSYMFKFEEEGYAIVFELWFYFSEDGYRFHLGRKITREGLFDSYNHVFWDKEKGEYVCYFRGYHLAGERNTGHKWTDWRDLWQGLKGERHIRDIRRIVSKDAVVWSEPELIDYGADAPDYPMYTNGILPYPREKSLFVGIATRYNERGGGWTPNFDRLPRSETRKRAMETSPREGLNISDNVFMFSRDGKLFHRVDEAFMTPGPEARRNWCYGDCYVSSGFFPVKGLEGADCRYGIITSVGAKSGEPMALHRYVIRQDGFVSREAPYRGAKVVTKPIAFSGSRMLINFSTSGRGYVYVTLRDESGNELRSCELFGDRVDREVDFDGTLTAFANRAVTVDFDMRDAQLYSFRFAGRD